MKQFIVLDHFLNKKDVVLTDIVPQVFDCIVPQKTTFTFTNDIKIEENDIFMLRDNLTKKIEYLGIIDTIERDKVTTVATLPFISICDNDLKVDVLNAYKTDNYDYSVQDYIEDQIETNFVNTDDIYSKFNIYVRDNTSQKIYYKAVSETENLLDVLNEIYLNTGLYIDFTLAYTNGEATSIYCDIYNANEQEVKKIRYDNPQIFNKIDYKFSQYDNYSKCTIEVGDTGRKFEFYLRQDNTITTNPNDELRIKKVKNKNVKFTADYSTEDELAEALVLLAQKTLCGDAFAYSIEFNITRKAISDWKFRQRCDFLAPDRLYNSYITNIQYNGDEARVTLGSYRYNLTDKFKALTRQPKDIGSSLNGIVVTDALGKTLYWFTQENGHLMLNYPENEQPPKVDVGTANERVAFHIDTNTQSETYLHLIYEYEGSEPNFVVINGHLIYKY